MEKHERLRQARVKAGFTSAAVAARRLGVPYGTYSGHENGLRGIKDRDAFRYAKSFGVSPNWLIFGDRELRSGIDEYALFQLGTAGTSPNGEVELLKDKSDSIEPIAFALEPFFPPFSMYIKVSGPYLRGIADENCYIICSATFESINDEHINQLCLCRLDNMKILIRTLRKGRIENRFDLDAPLYPVMQDQNIKDVSLIHGIMMPSMVSVMNEGYKFFPSDRSKWAEMFKEHLQSKAGPSS